ncbi:MAG: hypothetical protein L6Q76_18325 [Polyangiaceae bacterium]|nr:hypothetical protein [Polyangiaceae bacterium]
MKTSSASIGLLMGLFAALAGPEARAQEALAPTTHAITWHRFDDDIAAWLTNDAPAGPPILGSPEASGIARRLNAIRQALGPAASSKPGEAWLMAQWLEASARIRPLVEPYFTRRSVAIEGGREAPELGAMEGAGGFVAIAGGNGATSRLVLRSSTGDVLRIAVRARGPSRVVVREGDFAARTLTFATDSKTHTTWTAPRWVRAVVPVESRMAFIDVLEGEIAVAASAYRPRLSITDWSAARRDRNLQLERAEDVTGGSEGERVIAELAAIDHSGNAEVANSSLARLRAMNLPAPLRALVEMAAARSRRSPAEVPEATARAIQAASALKPEIAAPLKRWLIEHLAAVNAEPRSAADIVDRPDPPAGENPPKGFLTVGAYGLFSQGDTADEDTSQSLGFVELGAFAHRELVENRVWLGLRAFSRLRWNGSPSFGGDFAGDFSPDRFIPGGFLRGRLVAQKPADHADINSGTAIGLRATAGLFWSLPLFHSLSFVPSAGFTIRRADNALDGDSDPDRDVYTRFAETHPRYASFGMRFHARPFVDSLLRFGPSIRLSPSFSTLERLDTELEFDILAGRGLWPWIGLSWLTSYRPITGERPVAFVRDVATLSVTFWKWFASGHRLSLGSEASYIFDLPALDSPESPTFALGVVLQYDFSARRGLRDLPPHQRPFQDRLEEDPRSGRR